MVRQRFTKTPSSWDYVIVRPRRADWAVGDARFLIAWGLLHSPGIAHLEPVTNGPVQSPSNVRDTGVMVTSKVLELSTIDTSSQLAALAEPLRLRIVGVLSRGECCVCTLQELVPMASNLLSYHLRVLREAGLVNVTRRGRWMDYRLNRAGFDQMWRELALVGVPLPSLTAPSGSEFDQWFGRTCDDREGT
ncbi:MAG: metalloregulator ArsR/SmtB family transcription factor [Acidimicrobiales bacterium]